ncbi:MAG: hypothetical protein JST36_11245 [Bacteroidetes bacterium]|nr:hypothetical protein [Bacteroidota bacterium]
MEINIKGLSDVLQLITSMFTGVKNLGKLPSEHRSQLIKSLSGTAELVDETLTILKGHLSKVQSVLRQGDPTLAQDMVSELAVEPFWESKYRQFQLCDSLHQAGRELDTLLNRELLNKVAFNDAQEIQNLIMKYIAGEGAAGRLISELMQELGALSPLVASDPQQVQDRLELAKQSIQEWRDKFIDLEKELRTAI